MNNNIDTRAPFFPNSRSAQEARNKARIGQTSYTGPERNSNDRAAELRSKTQGDVKVSIPDQIRDYSQIKRAADAAPELNRQDKIAALKAKIQSNQYQVDYDAIADKMLQSEY